MINEIEESIAEICEPSMSTLTKREELRFFFSNVNSKWRKNPLRRYKDRRISQSSSIFLYIFYIQSLAQISTPSSLNSPAFYALYITMLFFQYSPD